MFLVVIDDAAVGENLFDVLVYKVNNGIAVGESLSLGTIGKDDFLDVVVVNVLDFAVAEGSVFDQFAGFPEVVQVEFVELVGVELVSVRVNLGFEGLVARRFVFEGSVEIGQDWGLFG